MYYGLYKNKKLIMVSENEEELKDKVVKIMNSKFTDFSYETINRLLKKTNQSVYRISKVKIIEI